MFRYLDHFNKYEDCKKSDCHLKISMQKSYEFAFKKKEFTEHYLLFQRRQVTSNNPVTISGPHTFQVI